MAAVTAPHGGRLRFIVAAGFALGSALVAGLTLVVAGVRLSAFVVYLVLLGGAIGALILFSTATALGLAHLAGRRAAIVVVAALGASISSVGVGYLLLAHPAGNHLGVVGLATLLGAGGWGAWHIRRGVIDPAGIALGLFLSTFVTIALFALTWGVGVMCKMVGI